MIIFLCVIVGFVCLALYLYAKLLKKTNKYVGFFLSLIPAVVLLFILVWPNSDPESLIGVYLLYVPSIIAFIVIGLIMKLPILRILSTLITTLLVMICCPNIYKYLREHPSVKQIVTEEGKMTKKVWNYAVHYRKELILNDDGNGYEKEYYNLGKLRSELPYIHGKANGIKKVYSEDGKLEEEETYKDGNSEGRHTYYYKNGRIRHQSFWKSGQMVGLDGTYLYEDFNSNKLVRKVETMYSDTGVCIWKKDYSYKPDGSVSVTLFHCSKGNPECHECYENTGWEIYDKDGNLLREHHYDK